MAESINFKSIDDLNRDILKNIHKIPKNVNLIVGVPRSGMLPANLIALYLNLPYTDLDSFIDGRIYGCGFRGTFIKEQKCKTILIVDDSICTGFALAKTKEKLKNVKGYKFLYYCVYGMAQSANKVDICCELVPSPRVFQWNMFHHKRILSMACMDIDGVLCRDPTPEENDDGEKYRRFLLTATPKFIPTVKIKTLISCRLEKYRNETEFWLHKHGIEYDNLIMLNLPDKASRIKWGKYGDYKAAEYKKKDYVFFIESSLSEAKRIKELTNKTVFCTETMKLV